MARGGRPAGMDVEEPGPAAPTTGFPLVSMAAVASGDAPAPRLGGTGDQAVTSVEKNDTPTRMRSRRRLWAWLRHVLVFAVLALAAAGALSRRHEVAHSVHLLGGLRWEWL